MLPIQNYGLHCCFGSLNQSGGSIQWYQSARLAAALAVALPVIVEHSAWLFNMDPESAWTEPSDMSHPFYTFTSK